MIFWQLASTTTLFAKFHAGILASGSSWPLLIIELVARSVPARLIIRLMERQMRGKWNFLHHPRLTSGGEG